MVASGENKIVRVNNLPGNDLFYNYTYVSKSDGAGVSVTPKVLAIRPGFESIVSIDVCNYEDETLRDLNFKMFLDNSLSILHDSTNNSSISNFGSDSLEIVFDKIEGRNCEKLRFIGELEADVDLLGAWICFEPRLTNYTDLEVEYNDFCRQVTGSYDPNHKELTLGNGAINDSIKSLKYFVQFQNTGTDTAFKVVVTDTLDQSIFNLKSIQLGDATHDFIFRMDESGVAKWTFNNIMLVDSNTNEPASNGNFFFEIDLLESVTKKDTMLNNVDIFFDFNPPIRTNTAKNFYGQHRDLSQEDVEVKLGINYYPNPISDFVNVQFESIESFQTIIEVYNEVGQLVFSQPQKIAKGENQFQLNLEGLESGVYLVSVSGTGVSFPVTVK